jgi:uncharacterized membrane protein HdeD (DUF308 family)
MQQMQNDPAEMLGTLGRAWGWVLFFGIVTLLLGIVIVADPSQSVVFVAVMIGIWFIVAGLFRLVASFTSEAEGHRIWWISLGLLSLLLGVYLCRHLNITIAILPVFVGLLWIIQGVVEFFGAIANREMPARGWSMFMGIVSLIAGIIVVSWPIQSITTLAWVLGIFLVIYGVMGIISAFQVKNLAQRAGVA